MASSSDDLFRPRPPQVPERKDDLGADLQALADFVRDLKQYADHVLGQPEQDRAIEDRRSMRETSAQREVATMRWEREKEEYDRRWEESRARWEEMQRDIRQRLDALEGRSRKGKGEEGDLGGEGTSDG